jgi:flagellar basal body-associated protein FliL
MMRSVGLAVWTSLVVAGASAYVVRSGWVSAERRAEAATKAPKIETLRLRQISVPILKQGRVEGYLFAKIAAQVALPATSVSGRLEDLLMDEAHSAFHAANARDIVAGQKLLLPELKAEIAARVNARTEPGVVRQVLIEELTVIDKGDARR